MFGSFRGFAPEWNTHLPRAPFYWPVNRDWRQLGPLGISGDWRLLGDAGRLQLIALPRAWNLRPEHLNFGPGWAPYPVVYNPEWVFFGRDLNADGTLNLGRYTGLPAAVRHDWSRYRYEGFPIW